jgi:AbrB family looped-hinge helix DNA binding protein
MGHCRVLKGGRITIPKEVRYKLSIKDGDFVDFSYQIWIYLNNQIQID